MLCFFCRQIEASGNIINFKGRYICKKCFGIVRKMLTDNLTENPLFIKSLLKRYIPREIKKTLDKYVIGQEKAKKQLAVAIRHHALRSVLKKSAIKNDEDFLGKANLLLIGPTGTGKTYLAQLISKIFEIPFCAVDATKFTEAGYYGEDVEEMIKSLYLISGYSKGRTEKGIIFIDEIDKICQLGSDVRGGIGDKGVINALLKIIEGKDVIISVPDPRGFRRSDEIIINTKDILFICAGAFNNLEKIVSARLNHQQIGFGENFNERKKTNTELFSQAEVSDLIKFGMTPELAGRLPVIATFSGLSEEQLLSILIDPQNSLLAQFKKIFFDEGINLIFEIEALNTVAEIAYLNGTGARGLRRIMEETLMPLMFELFSRDDVYECVVTEESVRNRYSQQEFDFETIKNVAH